VAGETDDVVVVDGTLAAGTYWATPALVSGSRDLVFRVVKARFGTVCETWAAQQGYPEGCPNDYAVDSFTDAHVAVAGDAEVSVAMPAGPGMNLEIDAEVLSQLIVGAEPSTGAGGPADYAWTPFPFVVRVAGGYVVEAHQFWVP
jgi:hypothetical protein